MLVNSGASPKSIECLLKAEAKFSAMTIAVGSNRLIVYNPRQPVGRRANSVAHELSHILLEHPMGSALGEGGCRHWNPEVEAEADWQAATLLVPRLGALEWIRSGGSLTDGARHFGVSAALFQWRVNQTGVIRQVRALTLSRRHRSLSHCA
jgi:Zn-dependent peptidase ImmA (M78 family)